MSEYGTDFINRTVGQDHGLFIDGTFRCGSGTPVALESPASGESLGSLSSAAADQVDEAVKVSRRAFQDSDWSTDGQMRAKTLRALADLVEDHAEAIAFLDSVEAGKTLTSMLTEDVPDVVGNLRYFADLVTSDEGRFLQDRSGWGWVRGVPVGVVGAVLPWNYPIAMLGWKVAPALAAGNAIILKPSEDSVLSALLFVELAHQAGVPAGIIAVLTGDGPGVGAALGRHADIDMLTFTGSGGVGRTLLKYSAESNLKKVSLELGGRAAYIIDAEHADDLAAIAADVSEAAFGNSGQNCTAASRVVVVGPTTALDDFRAELLAAIETIQVGNPLADGTTMGPVITSEARSRIDAWVEEALAAGARRVNTVMKVPEQGHWYPPTVLEDVPADCTLGREEIFGPVTQLLRVDSRDEAVALINDEPYGLASTVHCTDINQAKWWADQIQVGTLAINGYSEGTIATPFGGLRQSGFWGRDNGPEAMAGYQELTTVWIATK